MYFMMNVLLVTKTNVEYYQPIAVLSTLIVFAYVSLFVMLVNVVKKKRNITKGSIRTATDNLPIGLYIAREDGVPIIVNRKMYELMNNIGFKSYQSALGLWEEVEKHKKLKAKHVMYAGCHTFLFKDGSVWRFNKDTIGIDNSKYIQIVVNDITSLYSLSEQIRDNNEELKRQYKSLNSMLKNIADTGQQEEILQSKMRIHDQFGRSLLASRRYLNHLDDKLGLDDVIKMWQQSVERLNTDNFSEEVTDDAATKELMDVANVLGCKMIIDGDNVKDNDMLLSAIRECLTNAVRHGKATKIVVKIKENNGFLKASISNNGIVPEKVVEGGGLSSLRKKVESVGGTMNIELSGEMVLKVVIPVFK